MGCSRREENETANQREREKKSEMAAQAPAELLHSLCSSLQHLRMHLQLRFPPQYLEFVYSIFWILVSRVP
uniref:Uncharacterized protein n=1 Tax=Nelumbo nucifera TaxID=4432 RepID=A0A822XXM1_NELNU|nr:TPA_asm: hypothetical protein HUJ06_025937 [Nelumbo nucifera]